MALRRTAERRFARQLLNRMPSFLSHVRLLDRKDEGGRRKIRAMRKERIDYGYDAFTAIGIAVFSTLGISHIFRLEHQECGRMGIDKNAISELNLWQHQHDAVVACERYFQAGVRKAALVHMPTGTGKTGVMAVLATRRAVQKPILVVCPSAALVDQLRADFAIDFWKKIGAASEWQPDQILSILPSTLDGCAKTLIDHEGQRLIVVGTIQALQQIHAENGIRKLKDHIGTIIFDEGHREPAPLWADVVRGLAVPTVLFSATPFRSDLKVFDVDDEHIFFLSFKDAVDKSLIRNIEINVQPLSYNPMQFAEEIIATRDQLLLEKRFPAQCKMIVRAGSEESVYELFEAFAELLRGRGEGVLALHHNFTLKGDEGCQLRPDVPTGLRTRPEKFLIHQFKLTEGIDDPSCAMLALFEPFENERQLVQQIGRLTRQPGNIGENAPPAYVLAREEEGVDRMWNRFLSYDAACIANAGKPPIRNSQQLLERLVDALPKMDYFGGQFRERIDLDQADLTGDLRFPRSASVFEVDPNLDLDALEADISSALEAEDRFEHQTGEANGGDCRFHVTLRLSQSPFLAEYLFQSPSLEVTIYAKHGHRLYFYDSAGLWIDELDGVGSRINPRSLRSLLPDGKDNVVTFINVKNTDLGPLVLRGRSMSARSLERSGVFMGEHLNVITRAAGRVESTRRSVGFSRGRIRDGQGADLTAEEYSSWCAALNDELDLAKAASPILSRFATPTEVPAATDPTNILVDMLELVGEFRNPDDSTTQFDLENLCVDVGKDDDPKAAGPFRFQLVVDGQSVPVWINWDAKKRKYWLKSPQLSGSKSKDNERISLTRRLNQAQPFRIITNDYKHVYVHGSFYGLDLNLQDSNGAGRLILDLVTPVPGLEAITSEKGLPVGNLDTWPPESLFRFIDDALVPDRGAPHFGSPFPALVCDDLATEVADFIGVDGGNHASPPRAIFVVAKWHAGEPGVSASAFYDVCAQGVKNLVYLKSDGGDIPGSATKWDNNWRMTHGKGAGQDKASIPRRRVGPSSKAFRKLLSQVRSTPTSERAIWLVCAGGMLSKRALEREFKRVPPKPHVLQFYHLVISAFSSCQSVGVDLKIFCTE